MKTIVVGAGARPNFVKLAPVVAELRAREVRPLLVHTGQHYDPALSDAVFSDLGLPAPDRHLGVGSGGQAEQVGKIMIGFERVLVDERPDLVVVAGDVNSTLACALAAAKAQVPVAHLEAGLRSFDWTMPEELNRVLTDRVAVLLLTHSPEAADNLAREGVTGRIRYVGNTMIDSLRRLEPAARERMAWREHDLEPGGYVLVTLHRPSNVDEPSRLAAIVDALVELAGTAQVVFPIHPRTRRRLAEEPALDTALAQSVTCLPPLPYIEFLSLELAAGAVLTDSGGVQEETSALGVRCYTLRANTERPITISHGTNSLIGDDPGAIPSIRPESPRTPPEIALWDGQAGPRAAEAIAAVLA